MSLWAKFYDEVARCLIKSAREELGIKVGDEITRGQNIELARLRFRCYYQRLSKVGFDRFDKMIEELMTSIIEPTEVLEERQFQYESKFTDPREVIRQKEILGEIDKVVLEEIDEALDTDDTRLVSRMFILSFVGNIINQLYLGFIDPLIDVLNLSIRSVGLNSDWATALVAVSLEEAMVKKKLRELGYEPQRREKFHRLVEKLVEQLKGEGIRPTIDVFLTDGFRNIRHEVTHDPTMWKPEENEVNEIVRHTVDLAKALWPELFESKS